MSKSKIRVAIAGVGNCASSLIQGVGFYSKNPAAETEAGIMAPEIGGYLASDIEFVCAFDVDKRKVNKTLGEAIFAKPNCTIILNEDAKNEQAPVFMAPVSDGVGSLMYDNPEDHAFRVDENIPYVDIVSKLKEYEVDILINYLPVGSQQGTEMYAQACIDANVAFMNCIPVFIASDPTWNQKFVDAGIPIVGDDMKSQFGASIVSQMLQELAFARGHKVKCHIQRNVGGNTDFLNMEDKSRLASKKISKENVIRSQNTIRGIDTEGSFLHAGPSEYIRYYGDNKVANFRLELEGFMGAPVILDAQLSVQDSPNSAGVVIDAIRYLRVARELGIVGALEGPSAATQKTPPRQMTFSTAQDECKALANREYTEITRQQIKK